MMNVWVQATLWLVAAGVLMMFLGHRKRRRKNN
jgi:MYXO-CTERM domain-containing protein